MVAKKTIRTVLVEDSKTYGEMIKGILAEAPCFDYRVLHVSIEEAVDLLKNDVADLVILDLSLPPSYTGVEAVKVIKETDDKIPLVVITGDDDYRTAVQALQLGADEYIIKGRHPVSQMRDMIRDAFARKKARLDLLPMKSAVAKVTSIMKAAKDNPSLPPYIPEPFSPENVDDSDPPIPQANIPSDDFGNGDTKLGK